jgi:hypothetical protein
MEKKRKFAIALGAFGGALLIAVYGAGFSWRQVLIGAIALFLWEVGKEIWTRIFARQPFRRFQFRIDLPDLGRVVVEAGIYTLEELEGGALDTFYQELSGKGRIIFTWLEPELFYINATSAFSSTLEFSISLPAVGKRAEPLRTRLADVVEIRSGDSCYEVVLLTSEQQYCWPESTRNKGLVLFRLPYKFMWALQAVGEPWESNQKAHAILAAEPDLKYREIAEVRNGWDYVGTYAVLKWWHL